ncbi:MAG: YciI family protein [Arenicella sp.]
MPKHKYLCIQRSESGECEPPSPSQMEEMYAKFNAWREKYAQNIVDMGGKLSEKGKVVHHDSATDGPFVEAKEIIGGFMIIAADDMEQAMEVVRESPGVGMPGSSVEIRQISTS